MITILTPTYNRKHTLHKLYNSLVNQTDKDLEWIIVDDGSKDDTKKLIDGYIKENKIKIRYYKKKNGGKHSAINYGIDYIETDFVSIIDSDDYLTDDAIATYKKYIKKYGSNEKVGVISFNKCDPNGEKIGKKFKEKEVYSNLIDFRFNKGIVGDPCELIRTKALKENRFPIFENENFMAEAVVLVKIAFQYDTVFVNKNICVVEYLDDGLTHSMLKNRVRCPKGTIENCKVFLSPRFKFYIRFKNYIMLTGFSLIDHRSFKDIIKSTNNKLYTILLYPAGILFKYWALYKTR